MNDLIKIAAEYDSAGRIMARSFIAEFNKLANELGFTSIGKKTEMRPGRVNLSENKVESAAPRAPQATRTQAVTTAPPSAPTESKARSIATTKDLFGEKKEMSNPRLSYRTGKPETGPALAMNTRRQDPMYGGGIGNFGNKRAPKFK